MLSQQRFETIKHKVKQLSRVLPSTKAGAIPPNGLIFILVIDEVNIGKVTMGKETVSTENRKIANIVLEVFGGEPVVWSYTDENDRSKIDILSCKDRPYDFVTSYSTIGLSDYSIGLQVEQIPLGIEIVGACGSEFEQFPNIISTCALNIINSHFKCFPGAIFKSVVEMYFPSFTTKHILFVPPFGWDKEFQTLEFSTKKVAWLLAVPISDPEYSYAVKNGSEELEALFEEKQIDIYDLNRVSVL